MAGYLVYAYAMAQFNSFDQSGTDPHYNYTQAGAPKGPSPLQRIVVLGGIVIGVIVLIIVFFSLISGGEETGPTQDLAKITARHNTTLALIENYQDNIRSLETQNETARTRAVLLSDLETLTAIGAVATPGAVNDSTITSQLDSAATTTSFDSVFTDILRDEIEANTIELQALFNKTSNQTVREALNTAFVNQTALLE